VEGVQQQTLVLMRALRLRTSAQTRHASRQSLAAL
jgi:hypothetical protein